MKALATRDLWPCNTSSASGATTSNGRIASPPRPKMHTPCSRIAERPGTLISSAAGKAVLFEAAAVAVLAATCCESSRTVGNE